MPLGTVAVLLVAVVVASHIFTKTTGIQQTPLGRRGHGRFRGGGQTNFAPFRGFGQLGQELNALRNQALQGSSNEGQVPRTAVELTTPSAPPAQHGNVAQDLERLTSLYESGTLSRDEFEQAKKRVLGLPTSGATPTTVPVVQATVVPTYGNSIVAQEQTLSSEL